MKASRSSAVYGVCVGALMMLMWLAFLATGQVPEVRERAAEISLHLAALGAPLPRKLRDPLVDPDLARQDVDEVLSVSGRYIVVRGHTTCPEASGCPHPLAAKLSFARSASL